MNYFIKTKTFVLRESEILSWLLKNDKLFVFTGKYDEPCLVIPFDELELGELIRNGKLNSTDGGCLQYPISSTSDVNSTNTYPELPAFLFLVRDPDGNIKLCNLNHIAGKFGLVFGSDGKTPAASGENTRIDFAAILFNSALRTFNPTDNSD